MAPAQFLRSLLLWMGLAASTIPCFGQGHVYVGAAAGFAILSADATSNLGPESGAVSGYDPENGAALNMFAGIHFSDYVSFQGNYLWNRNPVTLSAARFGADPAEFYEQSRSSRQHAVVADLLLYFRSRESLARPYLSTGVGMTQLQSESQIVSFSRGQFLPPPDDFTSTFAALRVAVGLDIAIRRGWYVRYSFSESISTSPLSDRLTPPGDRVLKNFQNLFGLFRTF